jgi:SAM-dependent methyltransferase
MKKFRDKYWTGGSVLEIGGTDINGSVRDLFGGIYKTMDISGSADYVVMDPYNWIEIPRESFDYVISVSTLEHIEYPWQTMEECWKVLKSGGLVCHVAPSSGFLHRFPVDCYRYYADGGRALLKWAGFSIVECYTNNGSEIDNTDGGNLWLDTVMIGRKI